MSKIFVLADVWIPSNGIGQNEKEIYIIVDSTKLL